MGERTKINCKKLDRESINSMDQLLNIVSVNDRNSNYKEFIDVLVDSFRKREVLPFLGAGISRNPPSCLPVVSFMMDPLKKIFCKELIDLKNEIGCTDKYINEAISIINDARMERILDVLKNGYDIRTALGILETLKSNRWNDIHEALAILAINRYLKYCVTLNFDNLIEKAIISKKGEYTTYCPLDGAILGNRESKKSDLIVIKPHGSLPNNVQATLSEAGDLPSIKNKNILKSVIGKHKTLFIAGYSDNDWDIFPILADKSNVKNIRNVFWLLYCKDINDIKGNQKSIEQLEEKVKKWMICFDKSKLVIIGNVSKVFSDVITKMGLVSQRVIDPQNHNIELIKDSENKINILIKQWINDLLLNKYSVLISIAMLLECQTERNVLRPLLRYIIKKYGSRSSQPYYMLSWSYHMESRYREAIKWRLRGFKIDKLQKNIFKRYSANMYMDMGIHYLCCAKRFNFSNVKGILQFIYDIGEGIKYNIVAFLLAIFENRMKEGYNVIPHIAYYFIDFMHAIANWTLKANRQYLYIVTCSHRIVSFLYDILFLLFPKLNQIEYYWMRHLEAKLIGARFSFDRDYENSMQKLSLIEESCRLTYKQVHIGNVYIYRCLLKYLRYGYSDDIQELINIAEDLWSGKPRTINGHEFKFSESKSGLLRVSIIKKYIDNKHRE